MGTYSTRYWLVSMARVMVVVKENWLGKMLKKRKATSRRKTRRPEFRSGMGSLAT